MINSPERFFFCRLFLSTCCLLAPAADCAAGPLAIAYAGIVAPGTGGKTFYSSVLPYNPVANGDSVVFEHYTTDFKYGLWRWQNGSLSKIIYSGEPIPGVAGTNFSSVNEFTLNDAGRVAFSTLRALTIETPGGLETIAKKEDLAPGGGNGKFYTFRDLTFAADGQVSFRAQLTGGSTNFGVWRGSTTGIQAVAVDGQVLAGGQTITSTSSSAPPAAGSGSTALEAGLNPGGLNATIRQTSTTAPQIVVLEGQHAPGLTTETFFSFLDVTGNNAGQLAFRASLVDGPVHNAIFRDSGSGPQFLVGNESPMPGPVGARLAGLGDPVLNEAGIVAFWGYLSAFSVPSGTGTTGLWTIDPAGLIHEIAREKTLVPGLTGVHFGNLIGVDFQMNDTDQIAWHGSITGLNVNSNNDKGIWATDRAGNLVTIVREGDSVEVLPGVFRTVRTIDFSDSSFSNGATSAWTDDQLLVYKLTFTDSTSGIFVSSVPEPAGLALGGVALLALLAIRRWRGAKPA